MTLFFIMLRSDYASRWGEDPVRGIKLTREAAEEFLVRHAKSDYNGKESSLFISEKEIDLGDICESCNMESGNYPQIGNGYEV